MLVDMSSSTKHRVHVLELIHFFAAGLEGTELHSCSMGKLSCHPAVLCCAVLCPVAREGADEVLVMVMVMGMVI